jgi:hypothetical protein
LGEKEIDQAQGEITMRDGGAEGTVLGTSRVDMDPLPVAGDFGEAVDTALVDRSQPVGPRRVPSAPSKAAGVSKTRAVMPFGSNRK